MEEGIDFYFNEQGLMVLTANYLLKRGYCCKNSCTNCPWNYGKESMHRTSEHVITKPSTGNEQITKDPDPED